MIDISAALDMVGAGADALSKATGVAKSLKEMINTRRSADAEPLRLALDLFEALGDAQKAQTALENKLLALQRELRDRDEFKAEAARYRLEDTGFGATIYTLKNGDGKNEPAHSICPTCYAQSQKSILQPHPEGHNALICFVCGAQFRKDLSRDSGIRIGPVRRPGLGRIDDF